MSNTISFQLLPGEVEVKRIENTTVTQTAFLTYKKLLAQDVVVTNKRVAIINRLMPAFANLPFSIFYKESDYNSSKTLTSLVLQNVQKEKELTILLCKGFWIFPGQKWKIKDLEIADIALKNKNS